MFSFEYSTNKKCETYHAVSPAGKAFKTTNFFCYKQALPLLISGETFQPIH
ncbi:MAG: hypothetical protein JWQ40_4599 [Segetibacter sp.]|jgi:hypothetical protein|nr:hypothetical protein [Segetibacter sp.]